MIYYVGVFIGLCKDFDAIDHLWLGTQMIYYLLRCLCSN